MTHMRGVISIRDVRAIRDRMERTGRHDWRDLGNVQAYIIAKRAQVDEFRRNRDRNPRGDNITRPLRRAEGDLLEAMSVLDAMKAVPVNRKRHD